MPCRLAVGLTSSMGGIKATTLEMQARRRGHPYLRFDYRGHGQSSGKVIDCTVGDWCAATQSWPKCLHRGAVRGV